MELAIGRCQVFDGANLVAIQLHGQHQARADRLAIEQHGAGTAHPVLTTDVGAGQPEVVAQEIAQQVPRLDPPLDAAAVDLAHDR
jgi:hypothetical protein